jgi:NADPH:quinone reductase-like Zn-dependent oxidoreductase
MDDGTTTERIPATMRAVRLHPPGGLDNLALDEVPTPSPGPGEALVRVRAAAITRDELDWPTDRLPTIPSYELSGVVTAAGSDVSSTAPGDRVIALTPFDREGVAADFAVVPAEFLAPGPTGIGHAEAAALPMGALTAWQGLFDHGGLREGQRVLIHGAAGGVGHLATQLARWRGAHVVGTATGHGVDAARSFGADEVVDRGAVRFENVVGAVDLVFDTVGGETLARSIAVLREGGRLVSVAEEPPEGSGGVYFVVEPNGRQLAELARLATEGLLRPAVDSTFAMTDAKAAFERVTAPGKLGKVVLLAVDQP